jgi:hypothetical protein
MLIPLLLQTSPQTTSSTTALWFTLSAALGGVLLAGLFSLFTAVFNHRWKRQETTQEAETKRIEQLRQERLEAYSAYWATLQAWEEVLRAIAETPKDTPIDKERLQQMGETRQRLRAATARARLICSPKVFDALEHHVNSKQGIAHAALSRDASRLSFSSVGSEGTELLQTMREEYQGEVGLISNTDGS